MPYDKKNGGHIFMGVNHFLVTTHLTGPNVYKQNFILRQHHNPKRVPDINLQHTKLTFVIYITQKRDGPTNVEAPNYIQVFLYLFIILHSLVPI